MKLFDRQSKDDFLPTDNPLRALELRRIKRSWAYRIFILLMLLIAAGSITAAIGVSQRMNEKAFAQWRAIMRTSAMGYSGKYLISYHSSGPTTTCLIARSNNPDAKTTYVLTLIPNAPKPAMAVFRIENDPGYPIHALYCEKEDGVTSTIWRIQSAAIALGTHVEWIGSDMRLRPKQRQQVEKSLKQEAARISQFINSKTARKSVFSIEEENLDIRYVRVPYSAQKTRDCTVFCFHRTGDALHDVDLWFWKLCFAINEMANGAPECTEPSYEEFEDCLWHYFRYFGDFGLAAMGIFFMIVFPIFMAQAYHNHQRRMDIVQLHVSPLSPRELLDGHMAGIWLYWRGMLLCFIFSLVAATIILQWMYCPFVPYAVQQVFVGFWQSERWWMSLLQWTVTLCRGLGLALAGLWITLLLISFRDVWIRFLIAFFCAAPLCAGYCFLFWPKYKGFRIEEFLRAMMDKSGYFRNSNLYYFFFYNADHPCSIIISMALFAIFLVAVLWMLRRMRRNAAKGWSL